MAKSSGSKGRQSYGGGKRRGKSFRLTPKTAPIFLLMLLLLWGLNKLNPEKYPFELPAALEQAYVDILEEDVDKSSAEDDPHTELQLEGPDFDLSSVPAYQGESYVLINGNVPSFPEEDRAATYSFEEYSDLDELGRCGTAYANVSVDIMPTEKRGEIGMVKPSGWVQQKYDTALVEGGMLYNRCHLIAFQLAGENANERNLITGTRYMNTEMIPFENEVAEYVKTTKNHVLYRVSPIFSGDNLLASGVTMEAWSVEDQGRGVCFYVYLYNVQPGIEIDYATGKSRRAGK